MFLITFIFSRYCISNIPILYDHNLKMAALKDVVPVYKNLKEEWAATPCNLKKCGELLNQLKVI